jgi:TfoX/Sxy family transcriptional regulator of competence genes
MACDEHLVARIRRDLRTTPTVDERRMFGGVCFTLNGNMVCGVVKDELMVRVGGDAHELALARPHAREMDFTGRPMRGYVFVSAEGVQNDEALWSWIEQGLAFVGTLASKVPKSKRT